MSLNKKENPRLAVGVPRSIDTAFPAFKFFWVSTKAHIFVLLVTTVESLPYRGGVVSVSQWHEEICLYSWQESPMLDISNVGVWKRVILWPSSLGVWHLSRKKHSVTATATWHWTTVTAFQGQLKDKEWITMMNGSGWEGWMAVARTAREPLTDGSPWHQSDDQNRFLECAQHVWNGKTGKH